VPNPENAVDLSRALLGVVDAYVTKLPRDRKFTIGNRLLDRVITVLENATQAYYSPRSQKASLLNAININLEVIRQLLRFLYEVKVHDLQKHKHLNHGIDELGRAIGGWLKSLSAAAPLT
jgi:hypothetical protein